MSEITGTTAQAASDFDARIDQAAGEYRDICQGGRGCAATGECTVTTPGGCGVITRLAGRCIAAIPAGQERDVLKSVIWDLVHTAVIDVLDECGASSYEAVGDLAARLLAVVEAQGGQDSALRVLARDQIRQLAEFDEILGQARGADALRDLGAARPEARPAADVPARATAPWTEDQAASLNAYQQSPGHPFTCAWDHHATAPALVAGPAGWTCPGEPGAPSCGYRQDWAHSWMADWSWPGAPRRSSVAAPGPVTADAEPARDAR